MTDRYIGRKVIWAWPQEKDGLAGYAVKYKDGYISWSPKDVFEEAYRIISGEDQELEFEDVLPLIKLGAPAQRGSWNAAGQYVFLIGVPETSEYWTYTNGWNDNFPLEPFFALKNAQDKVIPWVPSQGDLKAKDWRIVQFGINRWESRLGM